MTNDFHGPFFQALRDWVEENEEDIHDTVGAEIVSGNIMSIYH